VLASQQQLWQTETWLELDFSDHSFGPLFGNFISVLLHGKLLECMA
jgi:hypothetical protein